MSNLLTSTLPGHFSAPPHAGGSAACPSCDFSTLPLGPRARWGDGKGRWPSARALETHSLAVSHQLSDAGELRHLPRPRSLLRTVGTKAPPLLGRTSGKWLSALQIPARQCPCMSHAHGPQGPDPPCPLSTRASGIWTLHTGSRSETFPGTDPGFGPGACSPHCEHRHHATASVVTNAFETWGSGGAVHARGRAPQRTDSRGTCSAAAPQPGEAGGGGGVPSRARGPGGGCPEGGFGSGGEQSTVW